MLKKPSRKQLAAVLTLAALGALTVLALADQSRHLNPFQKENSSAQAAAFPAISGATRLATAVRVAESAHPSRAARRAGGSGPGRAPVKASRPGQAATRPAPVAPVAAAGPTPVSAPPRRETPAVAPPRQPSTTPVTSGPSPTGGEDEGEHEVEHEDHPAEHEEEDD